MRKIQKKRFKSVKRELKRKKRVCVCVKDKVMDKEKNTDKERHTARFS